MSAMEKYPRGSRGSPAKGVVRVKRSEGSNPSFSAKLDSVHAESNFVNKKRLPSHKISRGAHNIYRGVAQLVRHSDDPR